MSYDAASRTFTVSTADELSQAVADVHATACGDERTRSAHSIDLTA